MHDYVDQSMKNVENEISNLNKNVLNKEVESLEYNSKSFEQRLVTSLIVFAVMYIINLIASPFLTMAGLYSSELVRPLCLLASLVGTSVYNTRNIVKFKDRERFKDYLNSKKRCNRLSEEFSKTLDVAKLNTEITINQMTYNNLIAEKKILSSLEDRFTIDEKAINKDELVSGYKSLLCQKSILEEKVNRGIKKCVLLGRYEKNVQGYKKSSYAIKYGFISLLIGMIVWNLPMIISSLVVGFPSMSITSIALSSFLPPAIVSVLFSSWGAKRENDDLEAFSALNSELGSEAFDGNFSTEVKKSFMEDFDKCINDYAGLNTKCELLKAQIECCNNDTLSYDDNSLIESQIMDIKNENEKGYSLSLKKRDNKK